MAESSFDPDLFMNAEVETGFDTRFAMVPPGEFNAQLDDIKSRTVQAKDGSARVILDVMWWVLDEKVKKETELEKPVVRQSVFLDINESGGLDRGKNKNVAWGRLLEALGRNDGKPVSPSGLKGSMAVIKVEHKPNPEDAENPYVNVTRVAQSK